MTETGSKGPSRPSLEIRGAALFKGFLAPEAQRAMIEEVRGVIDAAPLFRPVTSRGKAMSVRMTSAGSLGWVSDRGGYRYQDHHPEGMAWPAIPAPVNEVWKAVAPDARAPDCCLVNYYDTAARMGMHQDRDEADFGQPVVSISLGDSALFRIGNDTRGGPTQSVWLESGDVLVMGGPARLLFHGIDRLRPGSSALLPEGGRFNLTLRVAR